MFAVFAYRLTCGGSSSKPQERLVHTGVQGYVPAKRNQPRQHSVAFYHKEPSKQILKLRVQFGSFLACSPALFSGTELMVIWTSVLVLMCCWFFKKHTHTHTHTHTHIHTHTQVPLRAGHAAYTCRRLRGLKGWCAAHQAQDHE